MNFISEWVMQIIVFILMGTILELLIPNNAMKKYVNIVIGLLLLLILAKPILYLFTIDVTAELERMERTILQESNNLSETKTIMENQKKDIQAEQDAYIWSEVKLQLINEADPVLKKQYALHIKDVSFVFDDSLMDENDKLKQLIVKVSSIEDNSQDESSVVKPIVIETNEKKEESVQSMLLIDVADTLEQTWEVDKEKIHVIWEGGAS